MFERPTIGSRCLLVHPISSEEKDYNKLDEFRELVKNLNAEIVALVTSNSKRPNPKYYLGTGKLEEIKQLVTLENIQVVYVNHELTSAQERNLEKFLGCRVIDRTDIILLIFASRAQSFEGKLQVELATLEHMQTRLVRGWTHLERQKGGIGLRSGPGETQLEADRRVLREHINRVKARLAKVKNSRKISRLSREKKSIPTVALVGYTNAGKSTLFNSISAGDAYVANQLFATLDTSLSSVNVATFGKVIFADTVGFINSLPHKLVDAFRATLEETANANLLLHVVDASDEDASAKITQVNKVLTEINAQKVPQLIIYNKIDLLTATMPCIKRNEVGKPQEVWLSALQNSGIDLLFTAVAEYLGLEIINAKLSLSPSDGKLRALLYGLGAIVTEQINDNGEVSLQLKLSLSEFNRLVKTYKIPEKKYHIE